jgi:hypothetical protein
MEIDMTGKNSVIKTGNYCEIYSVKNLNSVENIITLKETEWEFVTLLKSTKQGVWKMEIKDYNKN